jgi:AhpD family alkylhydroperoxidase
MYSVEDVLPYLDKVLPEAWKAATAYGTAVSDEALRHGLAPTESELIKLRISQLNGCLSCLDLHSRQARHADVTQQKLDLLPAWRDTPLFSDREAAVLAIAEAATRMPLDENSKADLVAARGSLGDETFVAAEWVATTINTFNRISILSEHRYARVTQKGKHSDDRP